MSMTDTGVSAVGNFREDLGSLLGSEAESAFSIVQNVLRGYGLESLAGFVRDFIVDNDVVDSNVLVGEIRRQPEYRQRFAANEARRAAGLNAFKEGEYVAMENQYRQLMRASGLPRNFYDSQEDLQKFLANDVSVGELSERINQGYEAVRFADPEVIQQMTELYGVGEGELAAYFLDPDRATPVLLQRAQTAQTAAGAAQAGMQLTTEEAERLAQEGVTQQQARSGAAAITEAEELFQPTTGEQDGAFTREQQLGAVFGTDPAAAQRLRQRQRRRQAAFEGGGGFATGQGGEVTGLQ
jgi:hypothetical protein